LSTSTFDPKPSPKSTQEKSKDDDKISLPTEPNDNSEEENPWLQTNSSKISSSSKKNNKGIIKENNKSDKLVSKLKKQKQENQSQNGIEIDVNKVFTIGSVQMTSKSLKISIFFWSCYP
jgi:hypothetical protein